MKKQNQILKLPKAPLQEVIFEVRWELDISPDTNQQYDAKYETAVGMMLSEIKKDFPIVKTKFPAGLQYPPGFLNYQTVYQYWKAENIWPVLQLGPGIFTVNETEKNYEWKNHFFPLIKGGLQRLRKAYSKDIAFNFASLRYIDVIRKKDYHYGDWKKFIENNLNFNFNNEFDTRGQLKQFTFNQVFSLDDGSELLFAISNGKNHLKEDILIWETAVTKLEHFSNNNLLKWLDKSHKIISKLFKEVCKDELYDSFK